MASKGDKRKLAAILSADVVGYSRLMGADESGTLAQLKAHRKELIDPTIGDHDGRIVNTAGDSVLAEFASVVDAVQCAVAIQRVMPDRTAGVAGDRRIALRIGINLGDVIVEGDDIYGDGVNVAARLEGMAEPGGICISRSARDQVRDKLPINLEDLGEHEVKNISRPVRVFRVRIAEETPGVDAVGAQDVPDKPSIAVLSFVNMSGDTEQDYFADGIAEDIITGLSKVGSLFVIARNSSFAYKGANVNVTHVGRELGVRYVLEGSVRKAGERVRITAQLVKAESGHHLWAERYDRQLEDIFAVQDEVTEGIIASLEVTLSAGERRRLTRNHPNPEAYDHLLRAKRQAELESREGMLESRRLSLKATEIDPDYAAAYACIGQSYLNEQAWSDDPATCVEKALEYVRKGLAVDPNDAMAHAILSGAYLWQKQFDEALAEARKAVALDPNDADMAAHMGQVLVWAGESEQAIPLIERAMRANPTYPHWYLFVLGLAQLLVGRPNEAIASLQRGLVLNPDSAQLYHVLAASMVRAGKLEEARETLRRSRGEGYEMSPASAYEVLPFRRREDAENLIEALREIGSPG